MKNKLSPLAREALAAEVTRLLATDNTTPIPILLKQAKKTILAALEKADAK